MKYECVKCRDIVESSPIKWDMKYCSCKNLGVDNHNPPSKVHRIVGDFAYIKKFNSTKSMADENENVAGEEE